MALNYAQSGNLRINVPFQQRIGSAALKWASYILSSQSYDVSDGQKRRMIQMAQDAYNNPVIVAQKLQPGVVQDSNIQQGDIDAATGDSTVDDATLQTAVEATIQKYL